MDFDLVSFAIGVVTAVVFYFLWRMLKRRTSNYEPPQFDSGMTYEQAKAVHDAEFKKLTDAHTKNMESVQSVEQGDKFVLEYRDAVAKLGAKLAVFETKRAMSAGESIIPQGQQAPPPQEQQAQQAQVPAVQTPVTPQTSTYAPY